MEIELCLSEDPEDILHFFISKNSGSFSKYPTVPDSSTKGPGDRPLRFIDNFGGNMGKSLKFSRV